MTGQIVSLVGGKGIVGLGERCAEHLTLVPQCQAAVTKLRTVGTVLTQTGGRDKNNLSISDGK